MKIQIIPSMLPQMPNSGENIIYLMSGDPFCEPPLCGRWGSSMPPLLKPPFLLHQSQISIEAVDQSEASIMK